MTETILGFVNSKNRDPVRFSWFLNVEIASDKTTRSNDEGLRSTVSVLLSVTLQSSDQLQDIKRENEKRGESLCSAQPCGAC